MTHTKEKTDSKSHTEDQALACWSHGFAHLVATFGVTKALQIAGCTLLAVSDNDQGLGDMAKEIAELRETSAI